MKYLPMKNNLAAPICACFLLLLSACSSGDTSSVEIDNNGQSVIKMSPPAFLTTRAIDYSSISPIVTLNGQNVAVMTNGAGQWEGNASVPMNTDVTLMVEWVDNTETTLLLARAEVTESNVSNDITLQVVDSDYIKDGADFDADEDGISNITELRQATSPLDANDPGAQPAPLVRVLASNRTAIIDGSVFQSRDFWGQATYSDVAGADLKISNLLVDEVGTYIDQGPDYQWGVVHDEQFLTILVFGKSLDPAANTGGGLAVADANGDSGIAYFNDDSLEIFFDGNLSRGNDYDLVDDMHLIIPLVMGPDDAPEGNKSGLVATRIQRGVNVQTAVEFDPFDDELIEFASCLCTGEGERVTWEVRIDMAAAGIPVGRTFGFELQINQDDDGGRRDAKWAWWSPSRQPGETNAEADRTWREPSQMGLMQLIGFR